MKLPHIIIREIEASELDKIAELDRSEHVRLLYKVVQGRLEPERVDLQVPRWSPQKVQRMIVSARQDLAEGGRAWGAFAGDTLVGLVVLGNIWRGERKDQLQLALLHVGNGYRRQKLGSHLLQLAIERAREKGARQLYISATESQRAVGFYMSHGACLAPKVDPELFDLEPQDIHLVLDL